MKFRSLEPTKGYVLDNLYIPKAVVNTTSLKRSLTFLLPKGKEVITDDEGNLIGVSIPEQLCWDETAHHFIAPREFPLDFESYPEIEWVKEDLFTGPTINLQARTSPRPTQAGALDMMRICHSGTLNLACGLGKSALCLFHTVERARPSIIVVHQKQFITQWRNEIAEHIDPSVPIGLIKGDVCDWKGYPFVIALVHTLARDRFRYDHEFRTYFGQAYYDEGHHMSAQVFCKAADLFYGERYSNTATPWRLDNLHHIYQYHLGPVIYQDLHQDLIPEVIFYRFDWALSAEQEAAMVDKGGNNNYGLFTVMLAYVEWRNQFIIERALEDVKNGEDVMVLAHSVEHARSLYREAKLFTDQIGLITAPDCPNEDERIRRLLRYKLNAGIFDLGEEGLNKKSLSCMHIGGSFRSPNALQQVLGRIQRKLGTKKAKARIYEDARVRMSVDQCNDLRKYLRALGYPYKIIDVEIEL